jgi:hypothetical protein
LTLHGSNGFFQAKVEPIAAFILTLKAEKNHSFTGSIKILCLFEEAAGMTLVVRLSIQITAVNPTYEESQRKTFGEIPQLSA